MNAGSYRGNRYFVQRVQVGPNSWYVEAAEHGVVAAKPIGIDIHESKVTPEELAQILAVFSIFDRLFEEAHSSIENELQITGEALAREKVFELVRQAEDAKIQRAVIELENLRIQNEQIQKRAELEALDAEIASKRAAATAAAKE